MVMAAIGYICLTIAAVLLMAWLYRKIAIARKYKKTLGEIISVKNMLPLVSKRSVSVGKKYAYTECKYQGDAYVTVRFISKDGKELTRRYNTSEPLFLNINEHERIVPQYTAIFPEWQIGKRAKIYYDPINTLDIFVGKTPPLSKLKK